MDARIVLGNLPADVSLLDEPNMLVQSRTFTPARTKNVYRGANRATGGLEFLDPILTITFEAYISAYTGLCNSHPGTVVTELLNYTDARFGFSPDDGTMVYEDPSTKADLTNPETLTFSVVQYPFLVVA